MDRVLNCITEDYANFNGRARRPEFWYFVLFYLIAYFVAIVLDLMTGLYSDQHDIGLMSTVLSLGLLIPTLAVCARRLHDTDRSGWWQLVGLIPFVGAIILIVMCCQPGVAHTNRYGSVVTGH